MMQPRFLLFASLWMLFASEAFGMVCDGTHGLLSCPAYRDSDKIFCCKGVANIPYCCDFGEYARNNNAVMAGIVIGALVVFLIVPICCCCCLCAACPLARARVNRGFIIVR